MYPKVSCIIILPCGERIQKMSKASVLHQTVLIRRDWLNGRACVSQQHPYIQYMRERRGNTTSRKTWGNLAATVVNSRSSSLIVYTVFIIRYHSPACPDWPSSYSSLGDWNDKELRWPQKRAVSSLSRPYTSELASQAHCQRDPSTSINKYTFNFGEVPQVKCLFTAGRKSYLWFRY